jgi:hypothetical protein
MLCIDGRWILIGDLLNGATRKPIRPHFETSHILSDNNQFGASIVVKHCNLLKVVFIPYYSGVGSAMRQV